MNDTAVEIAIKGMECAFSATTLADLRSSPRVCFGTGEISVREYERSMCDRTRRLLLRLCDLYGLGRFDLRLLHRTHG